MSGGEQRRDRGGRRGQNGQNGHRRRRKPAQGTRARDQIEEKFDSETAQMILDSDLGDDETEGASPAEEHLLEYLSKDHVLANLDDAQLHEFKFLLRNRILQVETSHPPSGSVLQGAVRQAVFDDERRRERALSDGQLRQLRAIQRAIESRTSRADDGLQLKELSKSRQEKILQRKNDDDEEGAL